MLCKETVLKMTFCDFDTKPVLNEEQMTFKKSVLKNKDIL
jgi:hypothetical protein